MEHQPPWYVKVAEVRGKAIVLCDAAKVTQLHTDNQSHPSRFSVFLLDLPWRNCESCPYPHVASGGQELVQTNEKIDAERVYEGAVMMMRGDLDNPYPRIEIYKEVTR